jgi:hypothetical protein
MKRLIQRSGGANSEYVDPLGSDPPRGWHPRAAGLLPVGLSVGLNRRSSPGA